MDVSSARNLISNKASSNTDKSPNVRDTQYWKNKIKIKTAKDNQNTIVPEPTLETPKEVPIVEEKKNIQQVMNINDYRNTTEETIEMPIVEKQEVIDNTNIELQTMNLFEEVKSTTGSIIDNRFVSSSDYLLSLVDTTSDSNTVEVQNSNLADDIIPSVDSLIANTVEDETTPLKAGVKYKLAYVPENILGVLSEIVECEIESELSIKDTTYALIDINRLK